MLEPVTLEGRRIRLEPLSTDHVDELTAAGADERLWRHTPRRIRSRDDMLAYVSDALEGRKRGTMYPFVVRLRETAQAIGSTRYGNIDLVNRRLEIGWTWIAPEWQRTGVNREAKYLLLRHAFETLDCVRVEFKTDVLNEQSRRALEGIGAVEEGVLRQHVIVEGGRLRDTVYYSILAEEWPGVRSRLEQGLDT